MVIVKVLAWIIAILLAAKLSAASKRAKDVHISGGLYWSGVGACVSGAFFMLLVAFGIVIWIFAPLSWPHVAKVVFGVVFIAATIFLQQLLKELFEP